MEFHLISPHPSPLLKEREFGRATPANSVQYWAATFDSEGRVRCTSKSYNVIRYFFNLIENFVYVVLNFVVCEPYYPDTMPF